MVQLRHLRAGNQVNAMLNVGSQFGDIAFRDAENTVRDRMSFWPTWEPGRVSTI